MIQRIQTIFLFGIAICMSSMLFFNTWTKTDSSSGKTVALSAISLTETSTDTEAIVSSFPYLIVAILAVLAILVALVEIMKYANRMTQIKLGALNSLLMAASMGLTLYFASQANSLVLPEIYGQYDKGIFFPAIGLVLNMLANRFIRRDERLVKSVDRIR